MTKNLMAASHQWASRPVDETFWGMHDMGAALREMRERSRQMPCPVRKMRAESVPVVGHDSPDLAVLGSKGPIKLTHWSLGQLARYADAPADYIRGLPPALAAANLNHGLAKYHGEDVQLLLHQNDESDYTMRALTTADYSRLWNSDVVGALTPALDDGWMVPPARPSFNRDDPRARPATAADIVPGQDGFGLAVKPGDLIAPAGCYASDHDMFVFLVHPTRIVDLDGSGGLMRGVFLWNSEVGAGAFKFQIFLLEAVCGNHIVWGASDVRTFRRVHRGGNFSGHNLGRFGREMSRHLVRYADADTSAERNMVAAARRYVLGRDKAETVETLFNNKQLGLSRTVIEATYTVAEQWEHTAKAAPTTAWGMSHALTRYSQQTPYADERAKLDNAAGKLLALAYKG